MLGLYLLDFTTETCSHIHPHEHTHLARLEGRDRSQSLLLFITARSVIARALWSAAGQCNRGAQTVHRDPRCNYAVDSDHSNRISDCNRLALTNKRETRCKSDCRDGVTLCGIPSPPCLSRSRSRRLPCYSDRSSGDRCGRSESVSGTVDRRRGRGPGGICAASSSRAKHEPMLRSPTPRLACGRICLYRPFRGVSVPLFPLSAPVFSSRNQPFDRAVVVPTVHRLSLDHSPPIHVSSRVARERARIVWKRREPR